MSFRNSCSVVEGVKALSHQMLKYRISAGRRLWGTGTLLWRIKTTRLDVFNPSPLWWSLEALCNRLKASVQLEMHPEAPLLQKCPTAPLKSFIFTGDLALVALALSFPLKTVDRLFIFPLNHQLTAHRPRLMEISSSPSHHCSARKKKKMASLVPRLSHKWINLFEKFRFIIPPLLSTATCLLAGSVVQNRRLTIVCSCLYKEVTLCVCDDLPHIAHYVPASKEQPHSNWGNKEMCHGAVKISSMENETEFSQCGEQQA